MKNSFKKIGLVRVSIIISKLEVLKILLAFLNLDILRYNIFDFLFSKDSNEI